MENAPVILFIFNRPDLTADTFRSIAQAKPRKLFVIADGPRKVAEEPLCAAARTATDDVDWDCVVHRNYVATNLGCFERFVTGLDWAFSLTEEAIIFEDDMVPDPSIFRFASELLDRYRTDDRIMTIGGFSLPPYTGPKTESYTFTRYPLTWGWGTWARAWRKYDPELRDWPRLRSSGWLKRLLGDADAVDFYQRIFDAAHGAERRGHFGIPEWGPMVAWDFQWVYTCFLHEAFCIVPSSSMVRNLGFRTDSTNVRDVGSHLARIRAETTSFPLVHPERVCVSKSCDVELFGNWMRWKRWTPIRRLRFTLATNQIMQNIYGPMKRMLRRGHHQH